MWVPVVLLAFIPAAKISIFFAAVIVIFTGSTWSPLLFGSAPSSSWRSFGVAPFLLVGANSVEMIASASEISPAEITFSVSEILVSVFASLLLLSLSHVLILSQSLERMGAQVVQVNSG